ncbi:MAG: ABC transporter ATP-binding protein, partial [Methylobacterium sp.]|nr:ABC transporter ATP-binding protein [Methylobacterium sp.]
MAMACKPALLIADEPTSALDVTVQSEILDLLRDLRLQEGMATLFISHDLAVIARVARHTLVLYGGAAMETGDTIALLRQPRHPYTQGLLAALPHGRSKGTRLQPIPGFVPPARLLAEGCPFHGRCPRGDARCAAEQPPLTVEHTRAWCFHPGRVE